MSAKFCWFLTDRSVAGDGDDQLKFGFWKKTLNGIWWKLSLRALSPICILNRIFRIRWKNIQISNGIRRRCKFNYNVNKNVINSSKSQQIFVFVHIYIGDAHSNLTIYPNNAWNCILCDREISRAAISIQSVFRTVKPTRFARTLNIQKPLFFRFLFHSVISGQPSAPLPRSIAKKITPDENYSPALFPSFFVCSVIDRDDRFSWPYKLNTIVACFPIRKTRHFQQNIFFKNAPK